MNPKTRTMIKVTVPQAEALATGDLVERLMGKKAEHRFDYITANAEFVTDLDV
jgi:topoisomerase-4 subunit B